MTTPARNLPRPTRVAPGGQWIFWAFAAVALRLLLVLEHQAHVLGWWHTRCSDCALCCCTSSCASRVTAYEERSAPQRQSTLEVTAKGIQWKPSIFPAAGASWSASRMPTAWPGLPRGTSAIPVRSWP